MPFWTKVHKMHVYNNNINSNNNNDSAVNIPLGGSSCPLFQVKLDWGRETGGPGEKTLWVRSRTNNKLKLHVCQVLHWTCTTVLGNKCSRYMLTTTALTTGLSLLPLICIAWMYFIPSFSLSTNTTCWFTGHTLSSSNKWRLAWSFSIFWLKRVISVWEHCDCQAGSMKICSQSCTVHWTRVPENLPQSFIVRTCM